jgi:hypothetical protein
VIISSAGSARLTVQRVQPGWMLRAYAAVAALRTLEIAPQGIAGRVRAPTDDERHPRQGMLAPARWVAAMRPKPVRRRVELANGGDGASGHGRKKRLPAGAGCRRPARSTGINLHRTATPVRRKRLSDMRQRIASARCGSCGDRAVISTERPDGSTAHYCSMHVPNGVLPIHPSFLSRRISEPISRPGTGL